MTLMREPYPRGLKLTLRSPEMTNALREPYPRGLKPAKRQFAALQTCPREPYPRGLKRNQSFVLDVDGVKREPYPRGLKLPRPEAQTYSCQSREPYPRGLKLLAESQSILPSSHARTLSTGIETFHTLKEGVFALSLRLGANLIHGD